MLSVYGTVFNNADTVELSIRSIFSALEDVIEEVVVVDNYSYDGTWEILNELKKEFPLRLYRLKCSRGLGRQYAFTKTRGKYVLSMDFDTIYLKDFGFVVKKIIKTLRDGEIWLPSFISTRKTMEKVPWRNFNFGEDWELTHRAMRRGIKVKNLCIKPLSINVRCSLRGFGETRYVKNSISYYKRTVRDIFDLVLSNKFSPYFMLIQSKSVKALGKRWPLILLLSVINLYEKEPTISYVIRNWEYLLPEEMGLPREWFLTFFFGLRLLKCAVLEAIKDKIMSKTRDFKVKYDPQLDILFVYRDEEVFKFARDMWRYMLGWGLREKAGDYVELVLLPNERPLPYNPLSK